MHHYKISFVQKRVISACMPYFLPLTNQSWFYLCLLCGLLLLYAGLAGKQHFHPGCFPCSDQFCHAIFAFFPLKLLASWLIYFIIRSVNSEIVKLEFLLGVNSLEKTFGYCKLNSCYFTVSVEHV